MRHKSPRFLSLEPRQSGNGKNGGMSSGTFGGGVCHIARAIKLYNKLSHVAFAAWLCDDLGLDYRLD